MRRHGDERDTLRDKGIVDIIVLAGCDQVVFSAARSIS
jgi:hypothetical protein